MFSGKVSAIQALTLLGTGLVVIFIHPLVSFYKVAKVADKPDVKRLKEQCITFLSPVPYHLHFICFWSCCCCYCAFVLYNYITIVPYSKIIFRQRYSQNLPPILSQEVQNPEISRNMKCLIHVFEWKNRSFSKLIFWMAQGLSR